MADARMVTRPGANASEPPRGVARDALGVGIRLAYADDLLQGDADIGFLEAITENFLGGSALSTRLLDAACERWPVVLHGVGLNLLGHEPLDLRYLDAVAALAERIRAPWVTDHLCWTSARGMTHHDLLPVPFHPELIEYGAERARYVQQHLGRPFGLENLSSYVTFAESTLVEWEFYAQVIETAGCHALLDVNNIWVSACNAGFSARDYLQRIPFERVLYAHLAGHEIRPDGLRIDTHDHPVCTEVWDLYADAWRMGGPFPTLLEWDDRIPPLAEVMQELGRARTVRA